MNKEGSSRNAKNAELLLS